VCDFSDDVMAAGAVECKNGHVICAWCAKNSAPRNFGIRDLVLRSSLDEVLKWRGLSCRVCGVRGPLRRSLVTEAAVAGLPVRCGFTALGVACRWTGRRDEFHAHEHAFPDPDQLQPSAERRGTKRPSSAAISDSDNDGQRAKHGRLQQTLSVEEKSEDELAIQTADADVAALLAVPDINAAGERAGEVVTVAEVHRFNGDEILVDVGQLENEMYTSQVDQTTDGFRLAAVPDVRDADESEFYFVDVEDNGEAHGNDAGIPHNAAVSAVQRPAIGSHDDIQTAGELHVNRDRLQTARQKVGDTEVPVDDGAEFTHNAAQEGDEFYIADNETQPVHNSPANNRSEATSPASCRAVVDIPPGEFQDVERALQEAGLIPPPTVSLVSRAATTIYNAIARTISR